MNVASGSLTSVDLVLKHPALGVFLDALQGAADGKDEPRAELIALNAAMRAFGAPPLAFGAPADVPVGTMILHRTELVVLHLHRHFLSELAFTCEAGVESLLLTAESPCEDEAERIAYRGCGEKPSQRAASRRALATSAESGRPVRVLRAVSAEAATLALRSAGETAGKRRREVFRYDGLYGVQRPARDELATADADEDVEPSFILIRLPGQPPLPPGAATGRGRRAKRVRDEEAERRVEPLSLLAEAIGVAPSSTLPPVAEELCLDEGLTIEEALRRLHTARERLLAELTAQDAYALAKRAAIHQMRLRSAIELLEAGGDQQPVTLPPLAAAAMVRAPWPSRQRVR